MKVPAHMALKSIKPDRRRLADEVYDQLVHAIAKREISYNDRLVQEKLASELQISRTPVREALMRLEHEGVLRASSGGGFRLYKMAKNEIRELYQARAAIEGQAARILATRNDPSDIADLRETIKREEDIPIESVSAYFAANRNIHRRFIELTGNRFLLEMLNVTWGKAMAIHLFGSIAKEDLAKSLGSHMQLVDVIATGDKAEALEAITNHIQDGFELQVKHLDREDPVS